MNLQQRMAWAAKALIPLREKAYQTKYFGYSGSNEVDRFINVDSFAFLVGVISDYGVSSQRAWSLPFELKKRLRGLNPEIVARLSEKRLERLLREPSNLHRFPKQIARFCVHAAKRVLEHYDGITENIWITTDSAQEIKSRFLSFNGIGVKKAEMATKMLVRDKGLVLNDLWSVGLAPDVHIWRVLYRFGAIPSNPGALSDLIRVGSFLNSEYPAGFDDALWMLGRDICRPKNPSCASCPLGKLCKRKKIRVI